MLTQRLGSETQKNPEFIDSLTEAIKQNPGSCDEVWLATDYGFPSLEEHRRSAEILKGVAEKFRSIGVRVSLQLSNSVGHGEYMKVRDCSGLVYEGSPVEKMVGDDGAVADYCFCLNGENFKKYLMEEIEIYAAAVQPYCLWVDDDLRATNHNPVHRGCFCDECIKKFNERYGYAFDREVLVNELSFGDIEVRKNHIEFTRDALASLAFEMGTSLKKASPDSCMGLQGCTNGGFKGFGDAFIYDAMYKATGMPPHSRPGGGAYDDYDMREFIKKGNQIDFYNYMLPDYVTDNRPEIENLPDVVYGKSIAGTCFETTYYLASGNNAMSYAMLMNDYEKMSWHAKMLSAFAEHRPYWERLCEVSGKSAQSGLALYLPKQAYLKKCKEPFDYCREEFEHGIAMKYYNIPVAITKEESDVYMINGKIVDECTDEDIEKLLKTAVVADGTAVERLTARGYDCGARANKIYVQAMVEHFIPHKVNSEFANRTWCGEFARQYDNELVPTNEAFEPIGRYITVNGTVLDREHYSAAITATQYGAKWAVFAFDFESRKKSTEKRDQLLNACEYIVGKRFAAELITPLQAVLMPRTNKDGKTVSVSVTNCTVADSGELELIVRNAAGESFTFMSQYRQEVSLTAEKLGDNEYKIVLPNIKPWSVGTVFIN